MIGLHETCQQYVARRLSESWKIVHHQGFHLILQSPEGIIRPVDLRNDVETLRPNAAGSETSITYQTPDSGEHWDKVDEETTDESSTFVWTPSVVFQRDLYNLPAPSGAGTINFIKIYFRCWSDDSVRPNARPSLRSDSTVTDGTTVNTTPTKTTFSQQWNTNPADGQSWQWPDIAALQIGVSLRITDSGGTACTQVYVEVDYTPPKGRSYGYIIG